MKRDFRHIFFANVFILFLVYSSSLYSGTKLRIVTKIDGIDREYFIHIPTNHDSSKQVPLVFMLHGTGGNGDDMYQNSGWAELSEKEGFIAVFPSSLRYKIIDHEGNKTTTKWNTQPDADWIFQTGEKGGDDIKFLRTIIDKIKSEYKIDPKRIYLNGFSNGGQMAAKCSIDMGDVLAAVCSNASSFFLDTVFTPKRKLPYLYQVGNRDYGPGNVGPEFPEVPMYLFDSLISIPGLPYLNGKHYRIANNATHNFSLNPKHTGIVGDTNTTVSATYLPIDIKDKHEFKFVFVKDLGHNYPNWAPANHWAWLKQYVLEENSNAGKKIRVVTKVEEVDREYYIHLPAHYDSTKPLPMVMFFHGGGHDGELMYNISGWNDVADTAGIIMVYPSSLKYCVIEDGVQKQLSQWNNGHSSNTFCPNQKLKDDVLFVNTILLQMSSQYKIDAKRMYTVGFSNGGEFAASRTAIELSDKMAASISCGGGGALPRDTVLIPKRKLPVMLMFGNKDDRLLKAVNAPVSVPMGFDVLYSAYPVLYFAQVSPYVNSFGLDDKNYTTIGDTNTVQAAIFKGKSGDPQNLFYLVEVKNLEHEYPNGINHAIHGATYHWRWLNQYSLPGTTTGFSLTTNEGHGSGNYANGDTIHIWSKQADGKVFTHWSGDVQYLESPNEYHSRVFMPNKNIIVTANYVTLDAAMKLNQVSIRGAKQNKSVYLYLPAKNKLKAVVWIFHGTGGNALNMTSNIETKQFIDLMMTKNYGIVAITSEESQDQKDYDNNGEIQWSYGFDSTLVDFANIRAIRDSLIGRNLIDRGTTHLSYGWSAGGAFAEFATNVLNWRAAIGHTVSGSTTLSLNSKKPFLLNIGENDNHPGVGPAGNAEARMNIKNYQSRGVCAFLIESKKAPLYPERFDRSTLITEQQSKSIYNEIKSNNGLDQKNYLVLPSGQLKLAVTANPAKFPVIRSLNSQQQADVEDQLAAINAEHMVKSDINGRVVEFIENLCSTTTPDNDEISTNHRLLIYPNPASYFINIPNAREWKMYSVTGQLILFGKQEKVDISSLAGGIYYIVSDKGIGKFIKE